MAAISMIKYVFESVCVDICEKNKSMLARYNFAYYTGADFSLNNNRPYL